VYNKNQKRRVHGAEQRRKREKMDFLEVIQKRYGVRFYGKKIEPC
jgi:hypothetical protein